MIISNEYRTKFEAALDEMGHSIVAVDDGEYETDVTETRDTLDDFVAAHGPQVETQEHDGIKVHRWSIGRVELFVADAGEARLCFKS